MSTLLNVPAKLNLYLEVQGRRTDGYHALDSLVVFIDLMDLVSLRPAADWGLSLQGPWARGLEGLSLADSSLGAALMACRTHLGQISRRAHHITVAKHIPHGGGLGGGSCDAAALLVWLAKATQPDPITDPLVQAAARDLGADGPVCLQAPQPAHVSGLGEVVERLPAPLPAFGLVLVHPRVSVPTGAVFTELGAAAIAGDGALDRPDLPEEPADLLAWLATRRNDLQAPACTLVPAVAEALAALQAACGDHAALVRMTGAGSTCFALLAPGVDPHPLARALKDRHPNWWVKGARTLPGRRLAS